MSDEWRRTPQPPTGVIEVPLVGESPDPPGEGRDDPRVAPEPNWRRVVGLSLVGGTLLGIIVSVVILQGDDPTPPSTSTLPPDDVATIITTPPTLAPLEELPPPDDPALTREPVDDGPRPTTSQDRVLFDEPVTVPTYQSVPDAPQLNLSRYGLADAVAGNADDVARRSTTHIELGVGGFALDVTILRDPVGDRYEIIFETQAFTQRAVVDPATNSTYVETADGETIIVLNQEIISETDAATINEFLDRLIQGPVRPETLNLASARGRGLVTIDDVGLARQFVVNVAGDLIPEWQLYIFAPTQEFSPADRPDTLEYFVYVTEDGTIPRIDGVSSLGGVAQLVRHRIEVLDEPIAIELPEFPVRTTGPAAPTTDVG